MSGFRAIGAESADVALKLQNRKAASLPRPHAGRVLQLEDTKGSTNQGAGESGDELDEIGLTGDAGLCTDPAGMGPEVEAATPSASATSGAPPTSTMASMTRNSLAVRPYAFAIASGGDGVETLLQG